jgi:hypothetical protein
MHRWYEEHSAWFMFDLVHGYYFWFVIRFTASDNSVQVLVHLNVCPISVGVLSGGPGLILQRYLCRHFLVWLAKAGK